MANAAVVLLAGTETHADMARAANALETANEFKQAGGQVAVIFDGAATAWVPELAKGDHPLHPLFQTVRDQAGVCQYCANAFDVRAGVEAAGVPLLAEHDRHPSLLKYVEQGHEVITF